MIMRLMLFDVDGILVQSGSVKFDYWNAAVKNNFNLEVDKKSIYTHGKTDREILFELIQLAGIKDPEKDKKFPKALNDLGRFFFEAIKNEKIKTIPGVEKFIQLLMKEDAAIGLLTGNTRERAKAKLVNCGLWKYFEIGAFGDATKIRSELVPIALKEARDKLGIGFDRKDVYLVGDTVRDIQCAKEAGVNIVAVATGKETVKQLQQEKPGYLFKDFRDSAKIINSIF
ncbi:MAG: HAD hydrolase-like protein [Parcubacteria group bacterium]|jgi:phosphoglycolate phosphatase-like HAD superfamily hydrolase